jgi:hypothetical protein
MDSVEFHTKDEEAYAKWEQGLDKLRTHKEIKREVKAELKRGLDYNGKDKA